MFRHEGKYRTFKHNLRLASVLSFIAGMVNITGVLQLSVLTTNVTGHFAFFAEELVLDKFRTALVFLAYILAFLLGAFSSNLMVEAAFRRRPKIAHTLPLTVEITILAFLGGWTFFFAINGAEPIIACLLLFAMGIQNAMVTKISQATVRTTHLTGLFTDLGHRTVAIVFLPERTRIEEAQAQHWSAPRDYPVLFFGLHCWRIPAESDGTANALVGGAAFVRRTHL